MPSASGRPSRWLADTPASAITRPSSAALSSNSTTKVLGSLLSRTACSVSASPRARLNSRHATDHEAPSNTMAANSTR